ncbi:SDR family oxidoreductase [Exiguobacterium sp. AM39-5BH]|uniref:elongation factor P 5-aminopentanone reductase n=1 Tax=Exiguobacterium sp. AM39-5BH TaxID=2292355 RepID=UPI000FE248E7|nr:SDR family oxidoreductase [Exiguobacterium sp. AM39-5BH]RHB51945.1 SDR family NAD(P)-dependent oxidoreductase [Exiguobacterium sp. AM39-5BH]
MTTLITGASGAIGRAVALLFRDDDLILQAHTQAETLLAFVASEGLTADVVTCDLDDVAGLEAWLDTLGPVDRIIHVAGNHAYGLLVDQSLLELDRLYRIHVRSMVRLVQHVVGQKAYDRPLDIVVVSSVWGEVGAAGEVLYSTVKAAQLGFVKAFAREAGPFHVRINAVTPGWIDTPMNDTVEETKQTAREEIPLGRLGGAEEVAETIRFLCSPAAAYMTGSVLRIDGGWV